MQEDTIIVRYHALLQLAIPIISKTPRDLKFVLGDRLLVSLFDILEHLLTAYYRKHEKLRSLTEVNLTIEKSRHFLRVLHDLKAISHKQYGQILEALDEIGRMTGGWIKSLKTL